MKPLQLLVIMMVAGCSAPPVTPPAQPATQAAEPASTSAPAPAASTPDSVALADGLIADMRAKEAAFAKLEKGLPAVRVAEIHPVLSAPAAPSSPAPSAPSTPYTPPSAAAPPSTPAFAEPTFGGHNETWWKNEMHTIEARLESNLERLKAVEKQVAIADEDAEKARYSTSGIFRAKEDAYHQAVNERSRLKAAIESDRFAVERLREEARRANVPPGWLRWP
jgi:hypothetical protein